MLSPAAQKLCDRFRARDTTIGIIGLGYVGLPLVQAFIRAGFRVLGFDIDARKVAQLNAGESYIKHVPGTWIAQWLAKGAFEATCDPQRLAEPEALLICVPTPLTESRDPDLSYVESTGQLIAEALRIGQLVVLESTTYPGTTRNVLLPLLQQSKLVPGEDFYLAYSPEREDPGNPQFTASSIPKVIGGLDENSLAVAEALYSQAVVATIPVASCEIAEACKILENTYRSVNIAMVNELKVLFDRMGIDIWEVIAAAKTKPFGFQAFYPGPGLGGHCIPIDPFYLSWIAKRYEQPTRFIELAGEINAGMPQYVVDRLMRALNDRGLPVKGSRILVLGVAYKRDVDDPRESPAFKLLELLQSLGAELSYNDPHIPTLPRMRHYDLPEMKSQPLSAEFLHSQAAVLIATDHSAYDYEFVVQHSALVIDTRNATQNVVVGRERIVKA